MIHSLSQALSNVPIFIAQGGYFVLFIAVIGEALPFLGSLIPGHVMIIASGFLAKIGILSLPWVLLVVIVGAILGDLGSFYMGKKYGLGLLVKFGKYIFIKAEHIEKARKLIDGHTGKSLIIGKFSPLTRPLTPFLVGATGVPFNTFFFYNTIGSIAWVTLSVLLGYIFGASYHVAAESYGKFIVIAFIISAIIIWGYRFVNMRFHVFKKYELFVLGLNLLSLWALAKTIQDALSKQSFMANFDIYVNLFMAKHVTLVLDHIAAFISLIGSTAVTAGLGILIGGILLWKKKWRRGAIMILSIISTSALLFLLKEMFMRSRPENAFQILNDPSFPSGHAGLAAAFFVSIAYIFAPRIHSWVKRELTIVACAGAIIIIGLSRVIMNVHWASDVIAGWSLGIFLATASILFVRYAGFLFLKETPDRSTTEEK